MAVFQRNVIIRVTLTGAEPDVPRTTVLNYALLVSGQIKKLYVLLFVQRRFKDYFFWTNLYFVREKTHKIRRKFQGGRSCYQRICEHGRLFSSFRCSFEKAENLAKISWKFYMRIDQGTLSEGCSVWTQLEELEVSLCIFLIYVKKIKIKGFIYYPGRSRQEGRKNCRATGLRYDM